MKPNIIGKTIGTFGQKKRDALAQFLIEKQLAPNIVNFSGIMFYLIGAILMTLGVFTPNKLNWIHLLAGVVILMANFLEWLYDAIILISGRATKFGAFADSVTDRYSDIALFAGAIIYFALRQDIPFVVVSAVALVGSWMTSYTRARAESLLPGKFNAGYMERPERIVVLGVLCLMSKLYMAMLFIAILSNLATFHRIWDARQIAHNLDFPESARRGYGSINSPILVRAVRGVFFWQYPRQTWQHDAIGAFMLIVSLLSPLR